MYQSGTNSFLDYTAQTPLLASPCMHVRAKHFPATTLQSRMLTGKMLGPYVVTALPSASLADTTARPTYIQKNEIECGKSRLKK